MVKMFTFFKNKFYKTVFSNFKAELDNYFTVVRGTCILTEYVFSGVIVIYQLIFIREINFH